MNKEQFLIQLNGFEVHNPLNLMDIQLKKRNNMVKDYIKLQFNNFDFYNYTIFDTYNIYYEGKEMFGTKGYQIQIPVGKFTDYLLEHLKEETCFLKKNVIFKDSTQIWQQNNMLYITIG